MDGGVIVESGAPREVLTTAARAHAAFLAQVLREESRA